MCHSTVFAKVGENDLNFRRIILMAVWKVDLGGGWGKTGRRGNC